MPEPLPCGPATSCPQPNLIPGPVSPEAAPQGPPDCLSLPGDHSSAFQCENVVEESNVYLHLGMNALDRQRLGAGGIAVFDPGPRGANISILDFPSSALQMTIRDLLPLLPTNLQDVLRTIAAENNVPLHGNLQTLINAVNGNPRADSGIGPQPGAPLAMQFNNLVPRIAPGINGTIGWMWGGMALEYTGYYLFQNNRSINLGAGGKIDTFFYNPPVGFEGDRGLFLQADRLQTTFGSYMWNNEFNFRWWENAIQGIDLLFGVRYLEQREHLGIFVDDDGLPRSQGGGENTDPRLMATYTSQTYNHIVAPQFGVDYCVPVFGRFLFGVTGKTAVGANFVDNRVTLQRGDGYLGFDTTRHDTVFSQIYDIGAYVEYSILQRVRIRGGYNAMWLLGIATSVDQVDFNLGGNPNFPNSGFVPPRTPQEALRNIIEAQFKLGETNYPIETIRALPHGRNNTNGSVLYHGPMFQVEFLF
jgi:hypothetical protein